MTVLATTLGSFVLIETQWSELNIQSLLVKGSGKLLFATQDTTHDCARHDGIKHRPELLDVVM
jgi:hypothetical protein